METPEKKARRALTRLKRALEKARREVDSLDGAIRHAEGADFPEAAYQEVVERLDSLVAFTDEEARRLQDKILQAGGLEPGRIRRSSARD